MNGGAFRGVGGTIHVENTSYQVDRAIMLIARTNQIPPEVARENPSAVISAITQTTPPVLSQLGRFAESNLFTARESSSPYEQRTALVGIRLVAAIPLVTINESNERFYANMNSAIESGNQNQALASGMAGFAVTNSAEFSMFDPRTMAHFADLVRTGVDTELYWLSGPEARLKTWYDLIKQFYIHEGLPIDEQRIERQAKFMFERIEALGHEDISVGTLKNILEASTLEDLSRVADYLTPRDMAALTNFAGSQVPMLYSPIEQQLLMMETYLEALGFPCQSA